jgi:hypothetical protein
LPFSFNKLPLVGPYVPKALGAPEGADELGVAAGEDAGEDAGALSEPPCRFPCRPVALVELPLPAAGVSALELSEPDDDVESDPTYLSLGGAPALVLLESVVIVF